MSKPDIPREEVMGLLKYAEDHIKVLNDMIDQDLQRFELTQNDAYKIDATQNQLEVITHKRFVVALQTILLRNL